jgi:hypothetical protein
MSLRELAFGSPPREGSLSGRRIDVPLNWSELRFAVIFAGIGWLSLAGYTLIPGVAAWFGKAPIPAERRGPILLLVSGSAVALVTMVVLRYRRAAGVVFTTAGIWTPAWQGGRFVLWEQVLEAKLRDYGRGATDIELSFPDGRFRLYAKAFSDPYAVSRLIRQHVGEEIGAGLPTEGEI